MVGLTVAKVLKNDGEKRCLRPGGDHCEIGMYVPLVESRILASRVPPTTPVMKMPPLRTMVPPLLSAKRQFVVGHGDGVGQIA
mmetsp:Transcript_8371/g.17048  ORF Transcript_8371/g.17048 Transcript_8371/m.17048 type:complete len:83 (-) Transcript_8371:50-298(-)